MIKLRFCPECKNELKEKVIDGRIRITCPNCSFIFWDNPIPVVAGILVYKNKLVLVKPNYFPNNKWALVAGYVERGESAEQALIREVKEETNLNVKIIKPIETYPVLKNEKNLLYIVFYVEANDGEIKPSSEIEKVRLCTIDEAKIILKGTTAGKALNNWISKREITILHTCISILLYHHK